MRYQEAHVQDAKAAAELVCRRSDEVSQSYLLQTRSGLFTGHTLSQLSRQGSRPNILGVERRRCRRAGSWQAALHFCTDSTLLYTTNCSVHTPSCHTLLRALWYPLCPMGFLLPSPGSPVPPGFAMCPGFHSIRDNLSPTGIWSGSGHI